MCEIGGGKAAVRRRGPLCASSHVRDESHKQHQQQLVNKNSNSNNKWDPPTASPPLRRFCTPNGTLGALDTKSGGLLWSTQVVVPPGSMQAVTLTAVGGAALVGLDPPNAYSDITQVAHVDAGSGELVKVGK